MLDERKVKLMTKLALYEETHGKEDFKISSYYRKDYASLHVIYAFLSVSVGYVCLVGAACCLPAWRILWVICQMDLIIFLIFNHFGRLCGCCDCVLRNCQSHL